MNLKMYILINEDVEIGRGKLAGQVGHAVAEFFYREHQKELVRPYMETAQKKIILNAHQRVLEHLEKQQYISIRDLGLTDLEPNTLTCVNLGIIDTDNFPEELKWVKKLRLCK